MTARKTLMKTRTKFKNENMCVQKSPVKYGSLLWNLTLLICFSRCCLISYTASFAKSICRSVLIFFFKYLFTRCIPFMSSSSTNKIKHLEVTLMDVCLPLDNFCILKYIIYNNNETFRKLRYFYKYILLFKLGFYFYQLSYRLCMLFYFYCI